VKGTGVGHGFQLMIREISKYAGPKVRACSEVNNGGRFSVHKVCAWEGWKEWKQPPRMMSFPK
jgi:hypothetical protein